MTMKEVTRRKFILHAGAAAGAYALLPLNSIPMGGANRHHASSGQGMPLKDRAASKGLLYGSSAQQREFLADPPLEAAFVSQCNILVPELELKWNYLRPTPETFNFSGADFLYNFSRQHQMKFRGHTLVWQDALPKWFPDYINPQNASPLLLDHISKVVGRYAGKVHSWDVVNEAIWPPDKRDDGLRDTPWLRNMGTGYIETAFRAAAQADPSALLVWNENWLEEESPLGDAKRMFFLQHLKDQMGRGVPIQAIGLQSHIIGDHTNIAGAHFKQFLNEITGMGLKILVTEMDVRDAHLPYDFDTRDRMVAERYYSYLHTVLEQKSVVAVLTWGISNKYTWTGKASPRPDNEPVRPLLYDTSMNPTLAWDAVARAFDDAPAR
jgi:endo-1,4-beta-xylanase